MFWKLIIRFLINTGAKIPLSNSLGIDTVIPDFTYIEENYSRVKGIFLTDVKNESFRHFLD